VVISRSNVTIENEIATVAARLRNDSVLPAEQDVALKDDLQVGQTGVRDHFPAENNLRHLATYSPRGLGSHEDKATSEIP
jgi:hypothetical protein